MVLARDLHEKIRNIQIKVESSKRLFSIEEELEGTKDAINLLTAKFEKLNQALSSNAEPDDQLKKIKKIAEESDNVEVVDYTEPEQDIEEKEEEEEEEEEDDDPEPDYDDDDDEEEQETEEQIDARQECQLKDILTASQLPKVSTLDCVAGYNEAKEKQIADIIKAHSRDNSYPFTFDNGEGGIDEIFASNYQPIIKRLIYYVNKGYRSEELRIAYLELKCRDKNKYDQLKAVLIQLLKTHEKLLNGTYPNQQKKYSYAISKTLFLFKVRRPYFIENLIQHYQKLTKLKSDRFN
mgnify:CR=1 FL=1